MLCLQGVWISHDDVPADVMLSWPRSTRRKNRRDIVGESRPKIAMLYFSKKNFKSFKFCRTFVAWQQSRQSFKNWQIRNPVEFTQDNEGAGIFIVVWVLLLGRSTTCVVGSYVLQSFWMAGPKPRDVAADIKAGSSSHSRLGSKKSDAVMPCTAPQRWSQCAKLWRSSHTRFSNSSACCFHAFSRLYYM